MGTGMTPANAILRIATLLLIALAFTGPARAEDAPKVRVELVSDVAALAPGRPFWLGLRQEIAPGWHTYWINPGDSGEPAQIEWSLPTGFMAGEIAWPYPERIPVGTAMSFGYSRDVVLPVPVTPPADLARGTRVTLRGRASWLVCEKICIPEEAPVEITLPVAAGPAPADPRGAALIAAARRHVPEPSPWPASVTTAGDVVSLTVFARGLVPGRVADVVFYPSRWGPIEHAASQRSRVDGDRITLEMTRGPLPSAADGPIEGVLVLAEKLDGATVHHAFSLRAEPAGGGRSALALMTAVGLAVAGGLVLNLMPCVLPVLSVKALALVRHGAGPAAELRRHGLAYGAGVLASFAAVAGVLLALRAAGEQVGWGFQLQSPVFVTTLATLLFVMALSLSGLLPIGARLAGVGQTLAARPGYAGSFFTGALATVAATPCTAPFMGTAVGFALTQPWPAALLVFEALGVGLALPYVLLTLVPAWRRLLPRPGAWMERLRHALALPLYATVAWLLWVVSRQAGMRGVTASLAGLAIVAVAARLYARSLSAPRPWRGLAAGTAAALAVAALACGPLAGAVSVPPAGATSADGWEAWSPSRIAELRARGTPVFVNVTAAWCITCLVNERVALRSAAVGRAFADKGVVALKADWTRRDPAITRVLESHGRSGVPLYLLYPRGDAGGPTVLPQILSEGAVLDAIDKL
jgi:thiol:disulfide interchange protein/DsbC/DsbD-like thiol-disulfide interchange protein